LSPIIQNSKFNTQNSPLVKNKFTRIWKF